jgi:threonine 3-dehydrogenase
MKALSKLRPGPGLELTEVPVPVPGPNDVLIRVKKTSICGTDVHIYNWDDWAQKTIKTPDGDRPRVCRRDRGGRRLRAAVSEGRPGRRRRPHRLRRLPQLPRRPQAPLQGHEGGRRQPQRRLRRVPLHPGVERRPVDPAIPLDVLSCFDPLGNATHTALQFDLVGEDVLITGAGPIGCMAAAIARHCGARKVVVTDVNPDRLALAPRWAPRAGSTSPASAARRPGGARDEGGLRRRARDVRQSPRR